MATYLFGNSLSSSSRQVLRTTGSNPKGQMLRFMRLSHLIGFFGKRQSVRTIPVQPTAATSTKQKCLKRSVLLSCPALFQLVADRQF